MIKQFQYLFYRIDYAYRLLYRMVTKHRLVRKKVGNNLVMTNEETRVYMIEQIQKGEPFMVGRLGSIELSAIDHTIQQNLNLRKQIPQRTTDMLCSNAGFFPNDQYSVRHFSKIMCEGISEANMLGCFHDKELYFFKRFADRKVKYCHLKDVEPRLGSPDSWLTALKGKKVLVIHPYEKTIRSQYERRLDVFPNGFLPEFELKTIKAVQTIAGTKDERFESWFDALRWMEDRIDETDFDVALIGCGAYGFPLAAYVKKIGKQAVHIGGATQLIFGIIGSRWEDKEYVKKCMNQYWVRPLPEETPEKAKTIENSCYW